MTTNASETTTVDCAHHWMIPSPGGPTSVGTCKNCGAEKEFSNSASRGWVPRPGAKKTK